MRRLFRLSEEAPLLQEQAEEAAFRFHAMRYGMGHRSLDVCCFIQEDGSAIVRRRAIIEAYAELSQLDTFLVIPEESPPGEKERKLAYKSLRSLTAGRSISLIHTPGEARALSLVMAISPPLNKGETLEYILEEYTHDKVYAVDITMEELLKRASPYDYFGWNVTRPTQRLSLKVIFPDGVRPSEYAVEVRYASAGPSLVSERKQVEEQNRLEQPVLEREGDSYVVKLNVDYPMTGLVYLL